MPEALNVLATSPQAAHDACAEAWRVCKALTLAGKTVQIKAGEAEDSKTLEQLRYYFGPLLGAISEQVRTPDRWTEDAWHNLLKRKFLGYEIKKERVAGSKRLHITRRLRSLKDAKQRQMTKYIEEVTAYAITELGVTFEGTP